MERSVAQQLFDLDGGTAAEILRVRRQELVGLATLDIAQEAEEVPLGVELGGDARLD